VLAPRSQPPRRPVTARPGLYGITTAAQLAGMSVQALRLYERKGRLEPDRTQGGTRRYSDADINRLRRISELITEGINLTGIAPVLGLEADNAGLRTRNAAEHHQRRPPSLQHRTPRTPPAEGHRIKEMNFGSFR